MISDPRCVQGLDVLAHVSGCLCARAPACARLLVCVYVCVWNMSVRLLYSTSAAAAVLGHPHSFFFCRESPATSPATCIVNAHTHACVQHSYTQHCSVLLNCLCVLCGCSFMCMHYIVYINPVNGSRDVVYTACVAAYCGTVVLER